MTKKEDIREFENKLINEIKSHACLYQKNNPGYKNKVERNAAWDDISLILGKSVLECQKKWTTLRDSFRSYFRADQNVPSGSDALSSVKWVHFESLKFLIPYIKVPGDDCGKFPAVVDQKIKIEVDIEPPELLPSCSTQNETSTSRRRSKRPREEEAIDDALHKVLNAIENNPQPKPMELFFENIALLVEHFTPAKQIRLQGRILEILTSEFADEL